MSKAEIMEAARGLSEDDRLFLSAYLKHLSRVDRPEYKRRLYALNEEFSTGKRFTQEQIQRLHEHLNNEGL
jgi:hypothetical protein